MDATERSLFFCLSMAGKKIRTSKVVDSTVHAIVTVVGRIWIVADLRSKELMSVCILSLFVVAWFIYNNGKVKTLL